MTLIPCCFSIENSLFKTCFGHYHMTGICQPIFKIFVVHFMTNLVLNSG